MWSWVTLNYRLGNLGFLAHPNLDDDAGNFALMISSKPCVG